MVKVLGRAYVWLSGGALVLVLLGGLFVECVTSGSDTEAQHLRLRAERAALLLERSELESERTQRAEDDVGARGEHRASKQGGPRPARCNLQA
jgi:hypothetical protein